MNSKITEINNNIAALREAIVKHKVYSVINSVADLRIFMQYHVYAVWDFMSLLKTLQNNLTCTRVPWFPVGDANTRYLINEIVIGEESDVDLNGIRKSHFELYLDAMQQCGADTQSILKFTSLLQNNNDFASAFKASNTPQAAQDFVNFTFSVIKSNKPYLQSAIFTFGREDLIPGMFISMINDMNKTMPENISNFKYYLERHIEVDGDNHSHLAIQMTSNLCGENEQYWQEVNTTTLESLKMRIRLWDGAYDAIVANKN
ncbi:MAG: DUF3050 domain-containing protein [Bacteroidetes bacterium]|nr:DUF3050 domain-containing protein [Bacteroidota bacterium]